MHELAISSYQLFSSYWNGIVANATYHYKKCKGISMKTRQRAVSSAMMRVISGGGVALALLLAACGNSSSTTVTDASNAACVQAATASVSKATAPASTWDGPTTGSKAQTGKFIVYVSSDQQNGGSSGVGKGVQEATTAIGWKFQIIDGQGTVTGQSNAMSQAIALKPAGIVLGGFDGESQKTLVQQATSAGIKVVGWHAGAAAGPIADIGVFTNVSSDPVATAKLAADYAIAQSKGNAQAVILTDSQYSVAVKKSTTMQDEIKGCGNDSVLSYEDTPLADVSTRMGPLITSLLQRYGTKLNWMLGINDLYFDFGAPALQSAGIGSGGPPQFISAGDGSVSAYNRIRQGQYQAATIPEPLNLEGWQIVDELNRAIAGAPASGYVPQVHLVTKDNISVDGGPQNIYDPGNGYRDQYKKIWGI